MEKYSLLSLREKKGKSTRQWVSTPSAAGLGRIACQMSFFHSRVVSFPE